MNTGRWTLGDERGGSHMTMQLIPVLDLMRGQVVRGVAGQRDAYQPNHSTLVAGSDPVETACALRQAYGVSTMYLADLDALQGRPCSLDVLSRLIESQLRLVVDAGVSTLQQAERLFDAGVNRVVLPLESQTRVDHLAEFVGQFGNDRLVFSIDMKQGRCLGPAAEDRSPLDVARVALRQGIRRLIVLDLAGVGMNAGVRTLSLCRQILTLHDDIELWTGGGIRSLADLRSCSEAGIQGVLIASALHDGHVSPHDWSSFTAD